MDGSFACPECGSEVNVGGLAPGRQVRCRFCHRLLEVPYLPRVPAAGWKRRRFGEGKWVRWAWCGVAAVVVLAALVSGVRLARRQYRSVQEGAIGRLLSSSRVHEAEGRLDQALVDLDAAIELIRNSGSTSAHPLESERRRRGELARREAEAALKRLVEVDRDPYPLGDWLNLIARSGQDPDLSEIAPRVDDAFRRSVRAQGAEELEAARRAFDSGRVVAALQGCDRIAALLPHLSKEAAAGIRRETEELVGRLVATHGVALETPQGHFVEGSYESYRGHLLPVLLKALEARGYLPYRETSPWKAAWSQALYQLRMEVSERREGNYLSTENRLTRIESRLTLTSGDRRVWESMPTARTTVPLPKLPAYHSSRLALNRARSEELERLFYDDARNQIEAKFAQALGHMPACCP